MESPQLIWQQPDWPALSYQPHVVSEAVARARHSHQLVQAKLAALGWKDVQQLAAEAWEQEAVSTAAIEGQQLDVLAVRSSIARRLGAPGGKDQGYVPREVDGLLDAMDDALVNAKAPLTHERLQAWQAALFPSGMSGMRRVRVAAYREHAEAMQIVSGRAGHETVHYEAPPSQDVPGQMQRFLDWFNSASEPGAPVKAALAHLWFETIHPFEDGNGRVGRVLVDLVLARDGGEATRLVRISQRLERQRNAYYEQLERAQHGPLDVTPWVLWFIEQVRAAWDAAGEVADVSVQKARFWLEHAQHDITHRQRKAVNVLLDTGPGKFEGGMSAGKYVSLTGASKATATRELAQLLALGFVQQVGAGRSTRYYINLPGWAAPGRPPRH